MQHHSAPTRLLDWSDGALIALHFAVHWKSDEKENAFVYVLDPDRLKDELNGLVDKRDAEKTWKDYVAKHPTEGFSESEWEYLYLPATEDELKGKTPNAPIVMEFPHITRRVVAQRSRFVLFGSEPNWLADRLGKSDSPMVCIGVAAASKRPIRFQLRDCGITESIIFPDLDGLGREIEQLWDELK